MRLLFVTTRVPDFPDDGIKIISHNLIKHLKCLYNYSIDLICICPNPNLINISRIEPYCNSTKVFEIKLLTLFTKIINLFRLSPNLTLRYYESEIEKKINNYLKGKKYDAIYAMPINVGQYIVNQKAIPRILNTLDAHSLREIRQFKCESLFSLKKYYSLINYWKALHYEKSAYSKYNICLLVSEYDLDYLKKSKIKANLHVIKNGVNTDYYDPCKVEKNHSGTSIIFTGDYAYRPNELAAIYIYKELFIRLKNYCPNLMLFVVGKNPTNTMIKMIRDKNAILTGYVDDIRPYLKSAKVFVCPLSLGSGIKNKILEAMSMKLPIICSKVSTNGLEDIVKEGLLRIAENQDDFINNIKLFLSDNDLCKSVGENSRRFILKEYSWTSAAKKLNSHILKFKPNYDSGQTNL